MAHYNRSSVAYIFVYGTLRKASGHKMHALLGRYCEYVSTGVMQGKLYDAGGYPGVIVSDRPTDTVFGEVYKNSDNGLLLPRLDAYECCGKRSPKPYLFVRKAVPITLASGDKVMAWAYLYNRDVSDRVPIESGDYLAYLTLSRRKFKR